MPRAILIAGNAQRFTEETQGLRQYLVAVLGIGPKMIRESLSAYVDVEITELRIAPYSHLADALTRGKRPVLILNDCCHAMALAHVLEKAGVSKERVGLIGASHADKLACAGLIELCIFFWNQQARCPYGPDYRWGASLEHHFFSSKKPAASR